MGVRRRLLRELLSSMKYIKNLTEQQIRASLWRGEATLCNIEFEPQPLQQLVYDIFPCALEIVSARATEVSVRIPWHHIMTQSIVVVVHNVEVEVLVHCEDDAEWEEKVAAMQRKYLRSQHSRTERAPFNGGAFEQMRQRLMDGVQIQVSKASMTMKSRHPRHVPSHIAAVDGFCELQEVLKVQGEDIIMSPADVNRDPCCKLRDMATFSVEDRLLQLNKFMKCRSFNVLPGSCSTGCDHAVKEFMEVPVTLAFHVVQQYPSDGTWSCPFVLRSALGFEFHSPLCVRTCECQMRAFFAIVMDVGRLEEWRLSEDLLSKGQTLPQAAPGSAKAEPLVDTSRLARQVARGGTAADEAADGAERRQATTTPLAVAAAALRSAMGGAAFGGALTSPELAAKSAPQGPAMARAVPEESEEFLSDAAPAAAEDTSKAGTPPGASVAQPADPHASTPPPAATSVASAALDSDDGLRAVLAEAPCSGAPDDHGDAKGAAAEAAAASHFRGVASGAGPSATAGFDGPLLNTSSVARTFAQGPDTKRHPPGKSSFSSTGAGLWKALKHTKPSSLMPNWKLPGLEDIASTMHGGAEAKQEDYSRSPALGPDEAPTAPPASPRSEASPRRREAAPDAAEGADEDTPEFADPITEPSSSSPSPRGMEAGSAGGQAADASAPEAAMPGDVGSAVASGASRCEEGEAAGDGGSRVKGCHAEDEEDEEDREDEANSEDSEDDEPIFYDPDDYFSVGSVASEHFADLGDVQPAGPSKRWLKPVLSWLSSSRPAAPSAKNWPAMEEVVKEMSITVPQFSVHVTSVAPSESEQPATTSEIEFRLQDCVWTSVAGLSPAESQAKCVHRLAQPAEERAQAPAAGRVEAHEVGAHCLQRPLRAMQRMRWPGVSLVVRRGAAEVGPEGEVPIAEDELLRSAHGDHPRPGSESMFSFIWQPRSAPPMLLEAGEALAHVWPIRVTMHSTRIAMASLAWSVVTSCYQRCKPFLASKLPPPSLLPPIKREGNPDSDVEFPVESVVVEMVECEVVESLSQGAMAELRRWPWHVTVPHMRFRSDSDIWDFQRFFVGWVGMLPAEGHLEEMPGAALHKSSEKSSASDNDVTLPKEMFDTLVRRAAEASLKDSQVSAAREELQKAYIALAGSSSSSRGPSATSTAASLLAAAVGGAAAPAEAHEVAAAEESSAAGPISELERLRRKCAQLESSLRSQALTQRRLETELANYQALARDDMRQLLCSRSSTRPR